MPDLIFNIFPNERYIDMTLYQYGWERCSSLHSYGPATRNHYLFHFILSGRGTLFSTDSQGVTHTYSLKQNQGFLISPGQVNTYQADKTDPWEYAWLEFDGIRAKEFIETAGLGFDEPIYRYNRKELVTRLREEIMSIVQNEKNTSLHQIGHLYLFLDLLIQSSANHREITVGKLKDFYIREAVSFIEQNYSHASISVEDIATFCNLNRSYLGKIFRDSMNQTPQQFLIYYRMSRAAELLKFSEMPINEVARLVGYPNQLHFSRAFRNVFGLSPSSWRKENKFAKLPNKDSKAPEKPEKHS